MIGDGESAPLFDAHEPALWNVILGHYLDIERGDLFMALGRYNGSRGRAAPIDSILAAWRDRWSTEPGGRTACRMRASVERHPAGVA